MPKEVSLETLKQIPLFSSLSDDEAVFIAARLSFEHHKAADTIFEENSDGDKFYILTKGRVRISKGIGESQKTLAILAPGDFFGEIALIDRGRRSATATALESTSLVTLSADAFQRLIDENGSSAAKFLRAILFTLCKRIRATNEHLIDVLAWSLSDSHHQ
ncbi:MAG: hypothetical protein Kow0090_08120 [Myxococcota bacterium]